MIKIILESARNGVIKKVVDDNYGGGKEHFTSTDVFESSDTDRNKFNYIKRFFFDLCDDLGLEIGSKFDKDVLDINTKWGSHYEPTAKDVEFKIKRLKSELKELEEWKNI
jgi:hypothetical protein|tara:strand:+ start:1024 stop:1353 length:330 start_codon:yes stop_codon:yes gene_type:complete